MSGYKIPLCVRRDIFLILTNTIMKVMPHGFKVSHLSTFMRRQSLQRHLHRIVVAIFKAQFGADA